MLTIQEQKDFVMGPQLPISDSWLDRMLVTKAREYGEMCPAEPPTDDNGLNSFILLHYYDLPLSLYIAHRRTGDSTFLTLARKAADSWWKHPWIKEGTERPWPDSAAPPPRHAGLAGLILRALDGRPEMWDWIVQYTQAHLDIWCKSRINNEQLWYGPREVAFTMQFAAWVSQALSDSYPNAAQVRAQLVADLENLTVNYTGRLQYADGSWRDSSEWVDEDGGTMVWSMQPFIVGLLTSALVDVYQVVTTAAAKESTKNQILKACRHLYSDGPYAKDLIEQKSGKRVRGFHYFYHGGTTVNPTKYAKGNMLDPWVDVEGWWLAGARQAISTILPAFGYAYKISGDEFFKTAASEMFDSAYGGGDGFRALIDSSAKNYNQHARRVGSLLAWLGDTALPLPTPEPVPTQPTPTPTPEPVKVPSLDGTKATTIVDGQGATWTIGAQKETLRNGAQAGGGQGTVYKYLNSVVYILGMDSNWYRWSDTNSTWSSVGPVEPGVVTQPTPTPEPTPIPTPVPTPTPTPTPPVTRTVNYPKQLSRRNPILEAQWVDRFRLKKENDNGTAIFEKVS